MYKSDIPQFIDNKKRDQKINNKNSKKIKISKSRATDLICGIPLSIWKILLFDYLDLVDLIMISRTCKVFAGYPPLKSFIKERTKASFNKINKKYWNKIEKTNNSNVITVDYLKSHMGKFIYSARFSNSKCKLGVFCNKQRLLELWINNCSKYIFNDGIKNICSFYYTMIDTYIMITSWNKLNYSKCYWLGITINDVLKYCEKNGYVIILHNKNRNYNRTRNIEVKII